MKDDEYYDAMSAFANPHHVPSTGLGRSARSAAGHNAPFAPASPVEGAPVFVPDGGGGSAISGKLSWLESPVFAVGSRVSLFIALVGALAGAIAAARFGSMQFGWPFWIGAAGGAAGGGIAGLFAMPLTALLLIGIIEAVVRLLLFLAWLALAALVLGALYLLATVTDGLI